MQEIASTTRRSFITIVKSQWSEKSSLLSKHLQECPAKAYGTALSRRKGGTKAHTHWNGNVACVTHVGEAEGGNDAAAASGLDAGAVHEASKGRR